MALRKAFAFGRPACRNGAQPDQPGPELVAGRSPVIWKLALTYLVRFLVATCGSEL